MKQLHARGETIVEVLVVMAVLSSVLGSAFALTSRTVNTNRESQERSKAVGFAQNQIERLKVIVGQGDSTTPDKFCISNNGAIVPIPLADYPSVGNDNPDADNLSRYPAACTEGFYHAVTVYDNPNPPNNGTKTYTTYVRWDKISETGHNNVILKYRTEYVRDANGTPPPPTDDEVVPPPPPDPCDVSPSNAFVACYYNDVGGMHLIPATVVFMRNEPQINFDLPDGSSPKSPEVTEDNFSVRWRGTFNFEAANYTFTVRTDDGVRLYIDDSLVLDQWSDQSPTLYFITQTMTAGPHDLRYEFYENGGQATAQLYWEKTPIFEGEALVGYGGPTVEPNTSGGQSIVLWSSGGIANTGNVTTPAFDTLTVRARGDTAPSGQYAQMILYIDGVPQPTRNVTNEGWGNYADYIYTNLNKAAGVHNIGVYFPNDYYCPPCAPAPTDRNLWIDKIELRPRAPFAGLYIPSNYAVVDPRRRYL